MKALPESLQHLVNEFGKLPGIGRKSATRLAFHVLNQTQSETEELASAIIKMKREIRQCSKCFNFTEHDVCEICSDPNRRRNIICVIEDAQTLLMLEKTNEYRGLYHVLGGIISPLEGIGPENLRIKELLQRLDGIDELIIVLNPSTEGEATTIYLAKLLKMHGIKITRLARGIPLGGSLEFVDELTLGKALLTRNEV
ncbi:MAG: recombination mediator RecR [Calditrichia bacterium]|nr:recombination protein RecR [Calditrichota bacterium]MCB0267338.1 recombination protein RecR [Calditrichota bacterium]MCB0286570.1 recombination protein RecR [Calditrichota bacterium]MCB9069407.1 recombination protein RecR [Calditrichia bacterium]